MLHWEGELKVRHGINNLRAGAHKIAPLVIAARYWFVRVCLHQVVLEHLKSLLWKSNERIAWVDECVPALPHGFRVEASAIELDLPGGFSAGVHHDGLMTSVKEVLVEATEANLRWVLG